MIEQAEHLRGLLPHHLAHLRASGLTDVTILAAGIHSETCPDKLAATLGMRKPTKGLAPALVFPYVAADGTNGYHRVRPDTPRSIGGKLVKYESPREQPNRVYFSPGVARVIEDPTVEIAITEGEKKALAVTQFGPPCLGLVGVFGWKVKNSEQLLPDLERIAWKCRVVTIVFDSDVSVKPEIADAEARLAKQLANRGAVVRCVRLPNGPPSNDGQPTKVGADDYLVASGAAALQQAFKDAIEPPAVQGAVGKEAARLIEPASMATSFLAAREIGGAPCLRFHRGGYMLWHRGRYVELEKAEVQAELVRRINREYSFLTTTILGNIMAQVQAQAALSSLIEAPAWLGPAPHNWPASEVLATRSELVHIPSLVANRPYSAM